MTRLLTSANLYELSFLYLEARSPTVARHLMEAADELATIEAYDRELEAEEKRPMLETIRVAAE